MAPDDIMSRAAVIDVPFSDKHLNERLMLRVQRHKLIIISVSPFVMGVSSVELKAAVMLYPIDGYNGIFIAGKPSRGNYYPMGRSVPRRDFERMDAGRR